MEIGKGKFAAITFDPLPEHIQRSPPFHLGKEPVNDPLLRPVSVHFLELRPFLRLGCIQEIDQVTGKQAIRAVVIVRGALMEFSRGVCAIVSQGFFCRYGKVRICIRPATEERLFNSIFKIFFGNIDLWHSYPLTLLWQNRKAQGIKVTGYSGYTEKKEVIKLYNFLFWSFKRMGGLTG